MKLLQRIWEEHVSKMTGRVLIAVIVALLASNWFHARKAKASPQISDGPPACKSCAPISWGHYVGSAKYFAVVFRDSSGTLRFIANVTCEATPRVSLEIRHANPPN
jgi:hypothetical protein